MSKKERSFVIYRHLGTDKLLAVGQQFEVGGVILGPLWLLYKKAPLILVIMALAFSVGPLAIFGINTFTITWAVLTWVVHANSHVGLQALRLKSNGCVRVGDQRGYSHDDAINRFQDRT